MEWISLDKTEPELGAVVLVWLPDSHNKFEVMRYGGTRGFFSLVNDWLAPGRITHWMPVTAPAKPAA